MERSISTRLRDHARRLRCDQTEAERRLWARLRARQLCGIKFRRQHPIGRFIADFCCPERGLVVELDGGQHAENRQADQRRSEILAHQGYRVLRFWDNEVMADIEAVLERILDAVRDPHPNPLPERAREKTDLVEREREENLQRGGEREENQQPGSEREKNQQREREREKNAHIKAEKATMRFLLWFATGFLLATFLLGVAFAVEGDIVFKREGGEGGIAAAIFPHWFHRIRFKCYACHPTPFEMKAGANKITMDALQEGKFCGVCHNGKVAWAASFETCNRCHAEK